MRKVIITKIRSTIGARRQDKATMISLGLRKINQSTEHTLTPAIQGMLKQVTRLIHITYK